jgi:hypothetical protein
MPSASRLDAPIPAPCNLALLDLRGCHRLPTHSTSFTDTTCSSVQLASSPVHTTVLAVSGHSDVTACFAELVPASRRNPIHFVCRR